MKAALYTGSMTRSALLDVLTRMSTATLPAGPHVPVTRAAAIVARLRKGVRWADLQTVDLCGLPAAQAREFGAAVAESRVEILERRNAFRLAARAAASLEREAGLGLRTSSLPAALLVGRALCRLVTGAWDVERSARVLVAPNVLAQARLLDLDERDWCRWVALRTNLQALHHKAAPHWGQHLFALLQRIPESRSELARFLVLSDSLARASMDELTTADLPSLRWIRAHEVGVVDPAHALLVRALSRGEVDIDRAFAEVASFTEQVVSHNAVAQLLRDPSTVPHLDEYADFTAWIRRVR